VESIGSTELLFLIIYSAIGASVGNCRPRVGYAFSCSKAVSVVNDFLVVKKLPPPLAEIRR
jgi:hypothetical protein